MTYDDTRDTIISIDSALMRGADHIRKETFRVTAAAFVFVTRGSADIAINLKRHKVSGNDFITVIRGSIVQIYDWSDNFHAYGINFPTGFTRDIDLWKNTVDSVGVIIGNPVVGLTRESNIAFMTGCCELLHRTHHSADIVFRQEIVKNMLEAMMFAASGFYLDKFPERSENGGSEAISRSHDIFNNFMHMVLKNYGRNREVSYYADLLCITPKHLGYVVKSTSGKLASEVISGVVVMDAKSKLKSSNLSIAQIADSLGFSNPSFFCKYFRKHTGMTPKQFRNSETSVPA